MIAGNLLRAGDLSILQVSNAVSEEALERVHQEATCRIYYGCPDHADSNFSRPANPAQIRNVEFRFHMDSHLSENPPTMSYFKNDCAIFRFDELNTAPNSTCNLSLEYGVGLKLPSCELLNLFLQALQPLIGFENLVLKIGPGPTGLFFGLDPTWEPGAEKQATYKRKLQPALEHFLGPVTMVGDAEGRLMVFHPRRWNTKHYPGQFRSLATMA